MIGLGFILMGFGITVPAMYWVITAFFILIGLILLLTVWSMGYEPSTDLSSLFTLFMVLLIHLIFPQFVLTWWMWTYFISTAILSVFATIVKCINS